ncbi:MAG: diaminopimelate aminotransferase [Deltaproteobacteria bacterium]|nr:MAG: diaminopimelate aminotransferase [Deltaproteobacteria bacterium]
MKEIFKKIEQSRELIIYLQKELTKRVAIGPENGGDGEYEKALFIKRAVEDLQPDRIDEIIVPDNRVKSGFRPNLIARWKGKESSSNLWVLVHSDVVPPGDLSLWSGDPYEIRVEGDKIIGRGVEDNQHAFVSFYIAIKAVLDTDKELLRHPVGLAVVADEETGSKYGLKYVLEHHNVFKKQDLIIVPDGGNEEGTMIEIAEKSMLWLKFEVLGTQCHASTPDKGNNSLYAAARLIINLKTLAEIFSEKDPLFSPPYSTFEPTKIEANVENINTVPGKDVFYMDCRVLPSYRLDEIISEIKRISASIEKDLGVKINIHTEYRLDAPEPTPKDSLVVKALSEAIKEIKGKEAEIKGIGGGTVAAFLREKGLPAVVWSTVSDTAHKPDEYCLISNIIDDAKIIAYLMTKRWDKYGK